MTVTELIDSLSDFPADAEVVITEGGYQTGIVSVFHAIETNQVLLNTD